MSQQLRMFGWSVARCAVLVVLVLAASVAQVHGNSGTSVAVDEIYGSIYVTGQFSRWADFDPNPDPVLGAAWRGVSNPVEYPGGNTWEMGYLAKYAADGSFLWAIQLVGNGNQFLKDVAVGSDGFVYVVGTTQQATSFGDWPEPDLNHTVTAAFLARIRPENGHVEWVEQFDNSILPASFTVGTNIALEEDTFGITTGIYISGDAFIARYNLNSGLASLAWVEPLIAGGDVAISDLAADSSGVYATGSFRQNLDVGSGNLTAADPWVSDGFLVKLSDSGSAPYWEWATQFPCIGVAAVAVDDGYLYVSAKDVPDDYGIEFIDKLRSTDGTIVWHKPCRNASAYDIVARNDYLYLTGTFSGTVDFDLSDSATKSLTTNPSSNGAREIFLWKMDNTGALVWAGQMGGHGNYNNSQGVGIAVDSNESVVTTGWFSGSPADFDPSGAGDADFQLIRLGRGDAYVSKAGPNMSPQWVFQVGSHDHFADNGQKAAGIDYTETGSGWKNGNFGGYTGDFRTHAKGNGTNKATWTVSGLPAGTYEVFATWVPNSKNAKDAKYTVNGASVMIDQRVSPHSDSDPSSIFLASTPETGAITYWKSLGRVEADADGKLSVVLSDKASGIVVADAIRALIYQP